MTPVELLSIGATLALNAGFTWLTGSLLSRLWLGRAHAQLLQLCDCRLRIGEKIACLVCLGASAVSVWAATAMMGDVSLAQALSVLPQMLAQTGYGHSALAAIAFAGILLLAPHFRHDWAARGALLLLFALARSSMGHAGEHGLFSVEVGVEWAHLVLVGVWLGAVALAGWAVLPAARVSPGPIKPYLRLLSGGATVALAGIVASGVFNAWQRLDSLNQLVDSPYGVALTVKLALIGGAVLLGAYNRFVGFPALARTGSGHALTVLRIESVVLLGALAAASVLTAQAPP